MAKLEIYRGDCKTYELQFLDASGTAIDISGDVVMFTVKKDLSWPDGSAIIAKNVSTHVDAASGLTNISLAGSDTYVTPDVYYYDIQLVEGGSVIRTITKDRFIVNQDVTLRTSGA